MRFLKFGSPRGGFTFDVSGDLDFAQQLSGSAKDIEKAQKRALGTLRRRLKTEARRDIQREYNLKAQTINERLTVSDKYDGIALIGRSSGINLINFRARPTRKGVSYSIKKGQRKTMAHAFIQRTRSGAGPFVWIRGEAAGSRFAKGYSGKTGAHLVRGGGLHPGYEHGYPIFQRFGPNVAQMLKGGGRPERMVQFAQQTIEQELTRLLGPKS